YRNKSVQICLDNGGKNAVAYARPNPGQLPRTTPCAPSAGGIGEQPFYKVAHHADSTERHGTSGSPQTARPRLHLSVRPSPSHSLGAIQKRVTHWMATRGAHLRAK